jgi:hypothetical protein
LIERGCTSARPATKSRADHSRQNPRNRLGHTKRKGRLRCHKRPKSREETPKEGSDSESATAHPIDKAIATGGSIERKGSRTDTKVYTASSAARATARLLQRLLAGVSRWHPNPSQALAEAEQRETPAKGGEVTRALRVCPPPFIRDRLTQPCENSNVYVFWGQLMKSRLALGVAALLCVGVTVAEAAQAGRSLGVTEKTARIALVREFIREMESSGPCAILKRSGLAVGCPRVAQCMDRPALGDV